MATAPVAAGELVELAAAARAPVDEVLPRLGSGRAGLSSAEAADRLRRFGPNSLGTSRVTALAVLLRQLRNPLLLLLGAGALISFAVGEHTSRVTALAVLQIGRASCRERV